MFLLDDTEKTKVAIRTCEHTRPKYIQLAVYASESRGYVSMILDVSILSVSSGLENGVPVSKGATRKCPPSLTGGIKIIYLGLIGLGSVELTANCSLLLLLPLDSPYKSPRSQWQRET